MNRRKEWSRQYVISQTQEEKDEYEKKIAEIRVIMKQIEEKFTPEDIAFNRKMRRYGEVYELQNAADKLLEGITEDMPFNVRMGKQSRAYMLREQARKLLKKIDTEYRERTRRINKKERNKNGNETF